MMSSTVVSGSDSQSGTAYQSFTPDDYTVGWICALPCEMAAAKSMLDERHPDISQQDPADYNSYYLGQIQGHNVAIACLPAGAYGTSPASAVAKDMLRTFKALRFGLMVGIGGGAPSSEHDIRLGDIVVSQPAGAIGGVIQYDRGKQATGGKFYRTGSLNAPPTVLLNALSRLQTEQYDNEDLISRHLTRLGEKGKKSQKTWASPGAKNDKLYDPSYQHVDGKSNCNYCDGSKVILRQERDDDDPVVHCGVIASGNQLMKDAAIRDHLAQEYEALCFEMEAAGLMQDFPCIVIRGISDYADSHKNKIWQNYAAATAAACAKELLSLIATHQVLKQNRIPQSVSDIKVHQAIADGNTARSKYEQRQETRYDSEQISMCHQTFKTSRYEKFKNINPDRVPGTCAWVLKHERFDRWWHSSCNDLLWISADPGCGKSVLAKSLVDNELKSTSDHTICYFFFRDNDEQNSLAVALASLLHQLFASRLMLIAHAMPTYKKNGVKIKWEEDEMWRILKTSAKDQDAGNITCIIDALDECEFSGRIKLLDFLTTFYKTSRADSNSSDNKLRFIVTSRPYQDIELGFNKIPPGLPSIRLAGEDRNADIIEEIKLVIEARTSEAARLLELDDKTKDILYKKLMSTPHRTYLWLYLTMDELYHSSKRTTQALMEKIETLPMSVEQAYEKILRRPGLSERPVAEKLLHLVVAARRPLTLPELDVALALAHESPNAKSHDDLDLDGKNLGKRIRKLCGLFVFIHDSRVYLIHQTAKEFLVSKKDLDDPPDGLWKGSLSPDCSNALWLRVCLQYLSFQRSLQHNKHTYPRRFTALRRQVPPANSHNTSLSGLSIRLRKELRRDLAVTADLSERPLLDYSILHWPAHFGDGNHIDKATYERCVELFDDQSIICRWWIQKWSLQTALHASCYMGYAFAVSHILNSKSVDLDEKSKNRLLHEAVRGHQKYLSQTFVGEVLDKRRTNRSLKPSERRRWNRYETVVELLMKHGANIDSKCQSIVPLQIAVSNGDAQMAQSLLELGANSASLDSTKLIETLERRHEDMALLLISGRAEIHSTSGPDETALHMAARFGFERVVKALISRNVDVNRYSYVSGTALHIATAKGHEEIATMLLAEGANTNDITDEGTVLDIAIRYNRVNVARQLIEYGAKRRNELLS